VENLVDVESLSAVRERCFYSSEKLVVKHGDF
jgi:hypothetical protein